jgi:hypothetical protein
MRFLLCLALAACSSPLKAQVALNSYTGPYRLEKYLPLANINVVNTGGFGARMKALLEGEVEAASLLPAAIVRLSAARSAWNLPGPAKFCPSGGVVVVQRASAASFSKLRSCKCWSRPQRLT